MDKITPFKTNIYTFNVSEQIDCDGITNQIYDYQNIDSGVIFSNSGGWQSRAIDYHQKEPSIVTPIVNTIMPNVHQVFIEHGIKKASYRVTYWFNVNRKYNCNTTHNHLGENSLFSAVAWLKVPKISGRLVFERPETSRIQARFDEYNENNFNVYNWAPIVGDVVIFPSFLNHFVEQNLTQEEDDRRVSIAFNFYTNT
jgi:uncharacterized protein (TIGR02466 family)